jgi:phospholipid/cholesterol/gamma-HCH transport system substrate-binding protein
MSRSLSRLQAVVLATVVLVGLGLAVTGLFAIGKRQWLWSPTFHVQACFKQVRGVGVGTRVRVQGIEAGEVDSIEIPASPGGDVILRLRLAGNIRHLVRADASVRIIGEGMIGGKVVEIDPGTPAAPMVEDEALVASKPANELSDVLAQVSAALAEIREGQGSLSKLLRDPEAYGRVVSALQKSEEALTSFQQDADALKRLPVLRNYVEDPQSILVRPTCDCHRHSFAAADLFEPGRAVLTADGQQRLDELAPWLTNLKYKGSEVVVVAYADPKTANPGPARIVTRQQSEAVCKYLRLRHAIQKMGWFSSRKVTPLGLGTSPSPLSEKESLAPDRVDVLVFVPQA